MEIHRKRQRILLRKCANRSPDSCDIFSTGERQFTSEDHFLTVSSHTMPRLSEVFVSKGDVKRFVLMQFPERYYKGKRVLQEGSDVVYALDDTREWLISEQTYDKKTNKTTVSLNEPLHGKPILWPNILHPGDLLPESLQETDGNCVLHSLSVF